MGLFQILLPRLIWDLPALTLHNLFIDLSIRLKIKTALREIRQGLTFIFPCTCLMLLPFLRAWFALMNRKERAGAKGRKELMIRGEVGSGN